MYKKMSRTCEVVVLPTKSIVVFDVLVAVASSDRKVLIIEEKAGPIKEVSVNCDL